MKKRNWLEEEARREALRVLDLDAVAAEGGDLFADEEVQVAALAGVIERVAHLFGNRVAYGKEPSDGRMLSGLSHVLIALENWKLER